MDAATSLIWLAISSGVNLFCCRLCFIGGSIESSDGSFVSSGFLTFGTSSVIGVDGTGEGTVSNMDVIAGSVEGGGMGKKYPLFHTAPSKWVRNSSEE